MKILYNLLNIFIFCWGTVCLNGFRESLRYNALGDYTEENIDINTLMSLSLLNTIMNLTNYENNAILLILNNLVGITLVAVNIYVYQNCESLCIGFYDGNRFMSYYAFYSILPYIQFVILIVSFPQLLKALVKRKERRERHESEERTLVIL